MPPFRKGLLKRQLDENLKSGANDERGGETSLQEANGSDEELIRGQLDIAEDDTDDEFTDASISQSDQETEGVLFDDDADSTLDDNGENSDQSSELTDSESSNDVSDADDDNDSNSEEGEESGLGHTHSGSSGDDTPDLPTERNMPQQAKQQSKRKRHKDNAEDSIGMLAHKMRENVIKPVEQKDEYESGDTSDEEDVVNPRGAVPAWWYDEYSHVGYDLDGRRLVRPPRRDAIDEFLRQCEDPEFWRTVRDPATGQDVVLSKRDLDLIARIRQGQVPSADHDEYEPWVEWFSREVLATPLRAFPEHKRSFVPSRDEQRHVGRLVHALKMGWAKTRKQVALERRARKEKPFYNLWGSAAADGDAAQAQGARAARPLPAPRRPLPGHAESYNPPPEYLLDTKEMKEWNKLSETPWKRKYTFLPTKYASLRLVPAYERFTRERFLRCLDLYLAPRALKMRLTIRPEDLVPSLPAPRDLQPFPTQEAVRFEGHTALVRSADFDPSGQYAVSGSDDGAVRVWEAGTGRCLRTLQVGDGGDDGGEGATRVAWNPSPGLSLVAAATGARLLLLSPGREVGAHRVAERTDELLQEPPAGARVSGDGDGDGAGAASWTRPSPEQWARGVRVAVTHFRPLVHLAWHARGDYLCVTLADAASRSVVVHQLSKRRSQLPFARCKGLVQCATFHPVKPLLFVATQRAVRIYDLVKQELVRKLEPGAQWISAMAVHPGGDNLLVASYDRKCMWFDLELSARPYQTLRLHGGAVRSVAFHRRYPLFATAGDDPYIVVSHGMVYNDLLQNPLLVPLKQLAGPSRQGLCVTELVFHPTQPWLLAAGADHTLRLYS